MEGKEEGEERREREEWRRAGERRG